MGRRTLKNLGLKRAPSCFALFCKKISSVGVQDPPVRRIRGKLPVAHPRAMHLKWKSMDEEAKKPFKAEAKALSSKVQQSKQVALGKAPAAVSDVEAPDDCEDGQRSFLVTPTQVSTLEPVEDVMMWMEKADWLSSGAYGRVFRAKSKRTGLQFALKIAKKGAKEELLKEHEVLEVLRVSPHFVTTFGFFSDRDQHALVLELMDCSLWSWITKTWKDPPSTEAKERFCAQNLGPSRNADDFFLQTKVEVSEY